MLLLEGRSSSFDGFSKTAAVILLVARKLQRNKGLQEVESEALYL